MAFGSNAAMSRSIKLYPCVSGSSLLFEYRGSHFDVIAVDILAFRQFGTQWKDLNIAAVGGVIISTVSNTSFNDSTDSWQMNPTYIRHCNINGIAHIVVPTQGLIGGDRVTASASVIG